MFLNQESLSSLSFNISPLSLKDYLSLVSKSISISASLDLSHNAKEK